MPINRKELYRILYELGLLTADQLTPAVGGDVDTQFLAHAADTNNPHAVTKAQVSLGSVANHAVADQAEAEAGASNARYMTPLRTAQAIAALVSTETLVVKSADESVTASDALQDDAELLFAVGANQVWVFEMVLFVTSGTSNAPDIKWNWSLPAGATMAQFANSLASGETNINGVQFFFSAYRNLQDGSGAVLSTATIPATPVVLKGVVRVSSTSGSVQFRWAQLASDATATVVKADSYLRAKRVS